jgi:rsbT co-antagonist protein RsbR
VEFLRSDDVWIRMHVVAFRVRHRDSEDFTRCAIFRDLTEEDRAAEEERRLREQVIAAQQDALRELSTPLMPLGEGALAMPLVGAIDAARSQRVLEDLLRGINERGARHVIVDITGVRGMDAEVAQGILRAAQAARLLGAEVILTGIQPRVAMTLVDLGADMRGVVTKGTLRAGVAHVLARRRGVRS